MTFDPSQIASNPFFSGGFLLMLVGAAIAYLRRIPGLLWVWLKEQFTVTVSIANSDQCFDWAAYLRRSG